MSQIMSAPQSWYRGCDLESPQQNSYDPNSLAECPASFSQNAGWSMPSELNMPSLAPNSAAMTTVANSVLNGGPDGVPVAASPGLAAIGQVLGPASMIGRVPQIVPPNWNSRPAPPPSLSDRLGNWACQNPALAALSVAGIFFVLKGGKR